jgi:hypothetical protein
MKSIYNTILILLFISVASNASACHEGDFESSGKGHHKFGKNIGILQFTENSTISVSTTTSCDFYTAFLDSEYDFIQQQVAYGHGPHLDALAMINGCNDKVRTEFSKTLRVNYVELFGDQRNPHILSNGIEKLIDSNSTLKLSCRRV